MIKQNESSGNKIKYFFFRDLSFKETSTISVLGEFQDNETLEPIPGKVKP